jgi:hypothetical protein
VGWLLFFIHHISQAISVNHIVDRIAAETEGVIDDLMPWPRRQARVAAASPGCSESVTLSAQLLIFSDKRYDSMPRAALPFLRSRKDRLDVKTVLGGLALAGAPDFIDDRVLRHGLFS